MQDEPAAPGLVALHLDGAPVGPASFWLQRFDGRFFRREADRQTFSDGRRSSTVCGFPSGVDAVDISVAETVEGSRNLRHTDDVESHGQAWTCCARRGF